MIIPISILWSLSMISFFCFLFKGICFLKLTKSRVELLFSQMLVVVDIVVLKQVEQRAFKHILEEPLLLDDL